MNSDQYDLFAWDGSSTLIKRATYEVEKFGCGIFMDTYTLLLEHGVDAGALERRLIRQRDAR